MIRSGRPEKRGFGRPRLRGPFGTLVGGSVWGPRRDEQFMMFYKSFRCATVAKTKKKTARLSQRMTNVRRALFKRSSNVRRMSRQVCRTFVERCSNVRRTSREVRRTFVERCSNVHRTLFEPSSNVRERSFEVFVSSDELLANAGMSACVYIYIYVYICVCVCICTYIHTIHGGRAWSFRLTSATIFNVHTFETDCAFLFPTIFPALVNSVREEKFGNRFVVKAFHENAEAQ